MEPFELLKREQLVSVVQGVPMKDRLDEFNKETEQSEEENSEGSEEEGETEKSRP